MSTLRVMRARLCPTSLRSATSALWRSDGAATTCRSVTTSACLQRRFPRAKLPLNTELLPRSEQLQVQVTDKPDLSRGVPQPDGGVKYHGFVFYPRFPGKAEPPVTPAKLHRVQLVRQLKGEPYWVKNACKQLGVYDGGRQTTKSLGAVSVVKNIPEVNLRLYRVKHVVKIDPVTFPEGAPSAGDLDGWRLLEDGRVVRDAAMRVRQVGSEYDELKLSRQQVSDRLRLRWIKPFYLDEKRTV